MFLGDSRSPSGGGLIPAQDFRGTVDVDARAGLVCVRITGRIDAPVMRWREEEAVHGPFRGLMAWMPYGTRSVLDTNPTPSAAVLASASGATSDAPALGAPRWQAIFPVRTIGQNEPTKKSSGSGKESGSGATIAQYFPVGSEPETLTFGGQVYTLVSHDPIKTYTSSAGIDVGSYVYQSSGVAGSIPAKSAPAPSGSGASTAGGGSGSVTTGPEILIITVQVGRYFLPSPPPAPPGYVYATYYIHYIGDQYGRLIPDYMQFEYHRIGSEDDGGSDGNDPNGGTGSDSPGSSGTGPGLAVLPTRTKGYQADARFDPHAIPTETRQPLWPRFPTDHFGVVLQTMDDNEQVEHFLPTDPRLIAVNEAGGTACGSMIYDLTPVSTYDAARGARLHSGFRVIQKPVVKLGGTGAGVMGNGNALALQFDVSGQLDSPGGFAFDSGNGGVVAKWAKRYGGAMFCGSGGDTHQIGIDGDGHPINAMHLQHLALFHMDTQHDGPLYLEPGWPDPIDDGNFPVRVHSGYDWRAKYPWVGKGKPELKGKWGWYVNLLVTVETPKDPPPPTTPHEPADPPPPPLPPGPTTPGGGGGPTIGGGGGGGPLTPGGSVRYSSVITPGSSKNTAAWRRPAVIANELSNPGLLARPQRYVTGEPDIRYAGADAAAIEKYLETSPATQRVSAWGKQSGTSFGYTQQPGASRHRGGTAAGGQLITPPEVGIEDLAESFAPSGVTVSPTYFATAPGAYFGAGLPDLSGGGLKSGWSWGADGSDLVFYGHDSAGVKTEYLRFDTSGMTGSNGFSTGGGGGANTALSNLSGVAINTTLASDTDNTDDLGTSSIYWRQLFIGDTIVMKNATKIQANSGSSGTIYFDTAAIHLSFSAKPVSLWAGTMLALDAAVSLGSTPGTSGLLKSAAAGSGGNLDCKYEGTVVWRIPDSTTFFLNDGVTLKAGVGSGLTIAGTSAQKFAFHGATPVAQSTGWSIANPSSRKSLDVASATLAELREFVGTLAQAIGLDKGLIGA